MKDFFPEARYGALLLGLLLGLALPAAAAEHGAHEHGSARLDVVVDGATLVIALDSPLANLLGFEHAPRNDRQRAAVDQLAAALQAAEAFKPNPEAGCTLAGVSIDHPFKEMAKSPGAPAKGPSSGEKSAAGHADAEASWTFSCASPKALRQVDVGLFERFTGLRSLKVQLAGPRGQTAATLSRQQHVLGW